MKEFKLTLSFVEVCVDVEERKTLLASVAGDNIEATRAYISNSEMF